MLGRRVSGKTKGVYIAEDVTPYTAILSIPLDASLTLQCMQEIESLQKLVFFYQLLPEREDDQKLLLLCTRSLGKAASPGGLKTFSCFPRRTMRTTLTGRA